MQQTVKNIYLVKSWNFKLAFQIANITYSEMVENWILNNDSRLKITSEKLQQQFLCSWDYFVALKLYLFKMKLFYTKSIFFHQSIIYFNKVES
jgi:hypothetical protein